VSAFVTGPAGVLNNSAHQNSAQLIIREEARLRHFEYRLFEQVSTLRPTSEDFAATPSPIRISPPRLLSDAIRTLWLYEWQRHEQERQLSV
jgi:hypothetical protein